jgi:TonB family protein
MLNPLLALALIVPVAAATQTADHPVQVGGEVKPPVVIYQVDPRCSRAALKKRTGTPTVGLIVDEQGLPRDVHIIQSSGSTECDQADLKAVAGYRFRPATLRGIPVAVQLKVQIFVDRF